MHELLLWAQQHWFLALIAVSIIASCLEAVRDFILNALRIIAGREEPPAVTPPRTAPAQPAVAAPAEKKPGPCVHRNVTPIVTVTDKVVGWLCKKEGCGKRLPPDWAVREEDL